MASVLKWALTVLLGWMASLGLVDGSVDASWFFESPERLAILVGASVELVRRYVLPKLDSHYVVFTSVVAGIALTWLGSEAGLTEVKTAMDIFSNGVFVGLLASGAVGLAKSVVKPSGVANGGAEAIPQRNHTDRTRLM